MLQPQHGSTELSHCHAWRHGLLAGSRLAVGAAARCPHGPRGDNRKGQGQRDPGKQPTGGQANRHATLVNRNFFFSQAFLGHFLSMSSWQFIFKITTRARDRDDGPDASAAPARRFHREGRRWEQNGVMSGTMDGGARVGAVQSCIPGVPNTHVQTGHAH